MKPEQLKQLTDWDFTDVVYIPQGYDRTAIPEATAANMQILVEKYNELVDCLNQVIKEGDL